MICPHCKNGDVSKLDEYLACDSCDSTYTRQSYNKVKINMINLFAIWSNDHHAYWKPGGYGYTYSLDEAGRYTLSAAIELCKSANTVLSDKEEPHETMMPIKDISS